MMKMRIEFASDMGESFGNYQLGRPEEVMKLLNTAFVACGYHAGDPLVMHKTVNLCKQYGVVLGAHPGYPDLMGFGRRYMDITLEEARDYVIYQVGALKNFADHVGIKIRTAKPHGAFGMWCSSREDRAQAVIDGLKTIGPDFKAIHMAAPLSIVPLYHVAKKAGLRVVPELYPDLIYHDNGTQSIRRQSVHDQEAETKRILKWLETGKIDTAEGGELEVEAEVITIHGDAPNCPEVLSALRKIIKDKGIEIRSVFE